MRSMIITWILLVITLTILNINFVRGQETEIDSYIQNVMSNHSIPGMSLSVVWNGSIYLSKGYGWTKLNGSGDAVTENTLFYIASTTKAITSALVAQLLAESEFTLDTEVRKIMPDFHLSELYRQELTSVRDLLSHNVGVTDSLYNWLLGDIDTRQEIVNRARFFNPILPLRRKTHYNNLFYTAAGLMVENLTKPSATYEDTMRAKLFTPAGMSSSSFMNQLTVEQQLNLASPNEMDWRNRLQLREVDMYFFHNVDLGGPAGSIVSNAADLAKWLYILTHDGMSEGGIQVLKPGIILETMSPTSINRALSGESPYSTTSESYGLGWYTGFYEGHRMVSHSGSMFGYQSLATVYPELQLAIMTCCNGQRGNGLEKIHDYITKLLMPLPANNEYNEQMLEHNPDVSFFNMEYEDNSLEYKLDNSLYELRARNNTPSLEEYVGIFGNFAMGNISITINTTTGHLQGRYGPYTRADLFAAVENDVFLAVFDDPLFFFPPIRAIFSRDIENFVVSVTIPEFLPSDPPVFVRGLMMSSAPAPLEPVVCPSSAAAQNCSYFLFVMTILLMCLLSDTVWL